jgi:predicted metal-dependent hydrolase
VTLDWNNGALAEGLACYESARFFDAHEHWELVWLTLPEPEKSFLQALIQMTAAFHHLQSGNLTGAVSLLSRTARRLEACPAIFGGILVTPLRVEVGSWLHALENGASTLPEAKPHIRPVPPQEK